MALKAQVADEKGAFFIGAEEEEEGHHELILQKGNALASEDCLKEAIDWFSAAWRYGSVRPEQLSTFVDCILRNFKKKSPGPQSSAGRSPDTAAEESGDLAVFSCPNCHGFLGEPVTVACGHSYCKRCLQRCLVSKCRLCDEPVGGEERANVALCGLLEKWFPDELKKLKTLQEVEVSCNRKRYNEVVSLASDILRSGESFIRNQKKRCVWA